MRNLPAIFVTLILGPLVPNLSITVDSAFIISIENVIFSLDYPSKSEVLEFEWDSVLDPMINIIRERYPTVNIQDRIVELDPEWRSDGTIISREIK
jgi:hypothetical protein